MQKSYSYVSDLYNTGPNISESNTSMGTIRKLFLSGGKPAEIALQCH